MRRRLVGSLLVLAAMMLPAVARAQGSPEAPPPQTPSETPPETPPEPEPLPPSMVRSSAGVDAFWWSGKEVESALPIIPFVNIELTPSLVLDFRLPISFVINAHVRGDTKVVYGLGNPTMGLTYVTKSKRTLFFFGGRLSAPLAGASDAQPWQAANFLSAVAMTLWDLHLWAYKYLPIGLRGGVEYETKESVFFRGVLEPTLYIPLGNSDKLLFADTRKAEFFYQLRVEAEARSKSGWGGGLGLQVVHAISQSASGPNGDNAQGAAEPFVSYDSPTTFARLGVLVALDRPLGFGFDSGLFKVASLRLGVGSHF